MMRRALAGALLATGLSLGAACSGDDGPKPGLVNFTFTGATPAKSAIFKVVGPRNDVSGSLSGGLATVFADTLPGDTLLLVAVAKAGHSLQELPFGLLSVPDTRAAGNYTVIVVQVADATYTLQNASAYSISLTPSPQF